MTAVRLVRVALASAASPQDALRSVSAEPWPFALTGAWAGGGAIVGCRPLRVAAPGEDPFALLDRVPNLVDPDDAPEGAVGGGWFGWLGYGLGGRVEALPPSPPRPQPLPAFQLAYYDHVLRRDADGRWWFEALSTPAREAVLAQRLEALRARLAGARSGAGAADLAGAFTPPGPFRLTGAGAAGHLAAVADCRERIAAGEIFQANVCLRLEAPWCGDVAGLYAAASSALQPAYGAAFPAPWGGIASCSPELFLRRRGRTVESAPIKGTVARSDDDAPSAEAARAALASSGKDRAENVMIVDLMRNDLGRVCAYGSIAAANPHAEPHPGVWHLVSRVTGRLRDDVGDGALLRAAFPPGSVTGAPKVQAMHVIAALEASAREAYTGAMGFASPVAGLELNVAIRTFEARGGRLWLGVGGGIVADSDPARELEECFVKARPLAAAVGSRIEASLLPDAAALTEAEARIDGSPSPHAVTFTPTGSASGEPPRSRATTGVTSAPPALTPDRARPDPEQGVFETVRVRDGVAVRAGEHLARLEASVATCWDATLPADLATRVADAAAHAPASDALRVIAHPTPDGALTIAIETRLSRDRTVPVRLAPFTLPGGLGAHKWRDRRLVDALASAAAGATPLLLDGDGTVLEAAWGNVFAVSGDRLLTPPADGRLLPGVTRGAILRAAHAAGLLPAEQPLTLAQLEGADAILLSSALAGVVPAVLPDAHTGGGDTTWAADVAGGLTAAIDASDTAHEPAQSPATPAP